MTAAVCKTMTPHCEETHYSLLPLQTPRSDAVAKWKKKGAKMADDTAQGFPAGFFSHVNLPHNFHLFILLIFLASEAVYFYLVI